MAKALNMTKCKKFEGDIHPVIYKYFVIDDGGGVGIKADYLNKDLGL